jgi:hypothetical protein
MTLHHELGCRSSHTGAVKGAMGRINEALRLGHVRGGFNQISARVFLFLNGIRNSPITITISGSPASVSQCHVMGSCSSLALATLLLVADLHNLNSTRLTLLVHCHRHETPTPLHPCRHQPNLPFPSALGCVLCASTCGHRHKQILFSIADKNSYSPGHGALNSASVLD